MKKLIAAAFVLFIVMLIVVKNHKPAKKQEKLVEPSKELLAAQDATASSQIELSVAFPDNSMTKGWGFILAVTEGHEGKATIVVCAPAHLVGGPNVNGIYKSPSATSIVANHYGGRISLSIKEGQDWETSRAVDCIFLQGVVSEELGNQLRRKLKPCKPTHIKRCFFKEEAALVVTKVDTIFEEGKAKDLSFSTDSTEGGEPLYWLSVPIQQLNRYNPVCRDGTNKLFRYTGIALYALETKPGDSGLLVQDADGYNVGMVLGGLYNLDGSPKPYTTIIWIESIMLLFNNIPQ